MKEGFGFAVPLDGRLMLRRSGSSRASHGHSLALDATHLYWSDSSSFGGAVFRKRK